MGVGLLIIAVFTTVVLFMLFKYESGQKNKGSLTGRGGDFES